MSGIDQDRFRPRMVDDDGYYEDDGGDTQLLTERRWNRRSQQ